ncbi:MAG: adenylate/guanylate cyclase domain-containing protein [Cyclobacteriaceae bacterium]|nr:adenylate/guanylate cyclase domain-containing protein [Cyclobacteriaceae bacterium]
MKKRTIILGVTGLTTVIMGITMKSFHMTGANILIMTGCSVLIFGFLLSFLFERLAMTNMVVVRIGNWIAFLASSLIVYGILGKVLHLELTFESFVTGALLFVIHYIFYSYKSDSRRFELRTDRQLASIMFTDIVGYTALMGSNESRALNVLDLNRKIQKPIILKYRGRWLKEMGDGTLSIFYTASDAVLCALEINEVVKKEGNYSLRIGIHVGEIVFSSNDIFGDGVNVAARIMGEAGSGGICISEAVFQNIRNKENIHAEALGEKPLKNVAEPMRLYRILES